MRPGRIVVVVVGGLLALIALGTIAGGGTLLWANATQRDGTGFYNTPVERLSTPTYAFTGSVDFGTNASQTVWVPVHPAGTVRIRASSSNGKVLFIGIGPTAAVDSWLSGVAHEHVTSVAFGPFTTDTQQVFGTRPATAPTAQAFWTRSTSGPGRQTISWPTQSGRWSVIVMNADAKPAVAVDATVGMNTGLLLPIGLGLLFFGLVLIAVAALLLYLGLRERPQMAPEVPSWPPVVP
jgi:hypothetical protein